MDDRLTGSIVFVDDDDDDVSNCSIHSIDDSSKSDVRRGILRNPTNNHQNIFMEKLPAYHPISSPNRPNYSSQSSDPTVPGTVDIFWPYCETLKQQNYYYDNNSVAQTSHEHGSHDTSRAESWETHTTGSNAVARKKLTVRFSPEAGDACAAGSEENMRRPSSEFTDQVQCHSEQVQGQRHHEHRRLNVGRIAENKFYDGRNASCISDAHDFTLKTDSSKSGRKWYHFSFRSSKNREKPDTKVDSESNVQPTYVDPRHIDEVRLRCRGRRELREISSYDTNHADNGYVRTLEAQGYRLLPSSLSEPEQLSGYGRSGASSTQERVLSSSSTRDLRRSPTVGYGDRQSRGAAVRRSRSTVGDDRRHQMMSSPTPPSTSFPVRRNSTLLTDQPTTPDSPRIVPETFLSQVGNSAQTRSGWYYGLDVALDRQPPVTSHEVDSYVKQTQQLNLSTSVELEHDATQKSDAGTCYVVTTGGELVWSGQSWPTTGQFGTTMTHSEGERNAMISNSEHTNHESGSILVASDYIFPPKNFVPVSRVESQNWTQENLWNIGGRLPEIRVTPATDERRRRRIPATENQLSAVMTNHGPPRQRDYTAIYAWSPEFPTMTTMKRSATFGDEWNLIRSTADGYIDPSRHRGARMTYPYLRPCSPAARRHDELPLRTNPAYCSDFVDMRGICRSAVSAADLLQIELFYRSNKTEVISCACAARLYFASVRRHSSILGSGAGATQPEVADAARWYPTTAVGVPVIVLDSGGSRCRDRKLNLVLAEVGSGFALWRDAVDHLTCYRVVSSDFHSLRFSHDHSRLAGLRFADLDAAETFSRQLDAITSGPSGNALLNLSADRRVAKLGDTEFRSSYFAFHESSSDIKSGTKAPRLRPKLRKCDISSPCCFEHVTKFEPVPGFLV